MLTIYKNMFFRLSDIKKFRMVEVEKAGKVWYYFQPFPSHVQNSSIQARVILPGSVVYCEAPTIKQGTRKSQHTKVGVLRLGAFENNLLLDGFVHKEIVS